MTTVQKLSDAEQNALALLKENDHPSLWGQVVREVCTPEIVDEVRFLRLICQLKSQASDNPVVMMNILGDAYDAVIKL